MTQMNDDDIDRICFNCNNFFPASNDPTVYGICLNDPVFEPYLEELLENQNYNCCKKLIEEKKFDGNEAGCEDFDLAEFSELIEIDDESEFAKEIRRGIDRGKMDKKALEEANMIDLINNMDWKSMPVADLESKLKNAEPTQRDTAVNTLIFLIANGNKAAWRVLLSYFKDLPTPKSLEEVHYKIDLLQRIDYNKFSQELVPILIDELYRTPSNNTTRQWISKILKFLQSAPIDLVQEPLKKMLTDKRFSYRIKQKIRAILYVEEEEDNDEDDDESW